MVLITVTSTEEPFTCYDKFVTTFHTVVRKVFLDTGDTHEELHHGLLLRGCVGNWVFQKSPIVQFDSTLRPSLKRNLKG